MSESPTFQQLHKRLFYHFCFVGILPPGALALYEYCLFEKPSLLVMILLIRRAIVFSYGTSCFASMIFRRNKFDRLLQFWVKHIMIGEAELSNEKKDKILKEFRKKFDKKMISIIAFLSIVPFIYGVVLFAKPYATGAQYAFYPHDVSSDYHMVYVTLQFLIFITPVQNATYSYLLGFVLTLMLAELTYLKESLSDIMDILQIDKDGNILYNNEILHGDRGKYLYMNGVKKVDRQLKLWIKGHQRLKRWSEAVQTFMRYDISTKLICVCLYSCLCAFSIPKLVAAGRLNDVLVMVGFALGLVSLFFSLTRITDEIVQVSGTISQTAYSKSWFIYPLHIQKNLSIVTQYSTANPIEPAAYLKDNSVTFLNILSTAYKGLSFLLQAQEP